MSFSGFIRNVRQYYTPRAIFDAARLWRCYPRHRDVLLRGYYNKLWPVMRTAAFLYRRVVIPRKCVVVVIGSMGKTTTTRAVRTALGLEHHPQSEGNWASPLAENLFRGERRGPVDVLEVGIAGPGYMRSFARMLRPDVAVVTSVKSDHNRSFPTLEDTRAEKVKMVEALSPEGFAVLNGDDPRVAWMATRTRAKVLTYGLGADCNVRATNIEPQSSGTRLQVHADGRSYPVQTPLVGAHMVYPVLAAFAVATIRGVTLEEVGGRLRSLAPTRGRLSPMPLGNGVIGLDDSFKGQLESYHAALDALRQMPASRRVVLAGYIEEPSGPQARLYSELGERIGAVADEVVLFSDSSNFRTLRAAAVRAGLPRPQISSASSSLERAVELLRERLRPGDVLLVKAPFAYKFERVLLALRGAEVKCSVRLCRMKTACSQCPFLETGPPSGANRVISRLIEP